MAIYDGTDVFTGNNVTGAKLDSVSVWHGTTLPTAGSNQVPANGLFFKTDTGLFYENTGTLASPTWTARTTAVSVVNETTTAHSTTIGDYTTPSGTAIASSFSDNTDSVWGLNNDQPVEDFSTYTTQGEADTNWVSSDTAKTRADITNDRLNHIAVNDTTNDSITYDLGTTLSDTSWICRFHWHIVSWSRNTSGYEIFPVVGWFSASSSTDENTAQDFIGLIPYGDNIVRKYKVGSSDNATPFSGTNLNFPTAEAKANDDYYVEIKRTSATNVVINLYSDSGFATLYDTQTLTISSGCTGLRYFGMKNVNPNLNVSGTNTTWVDDIKIIDGTSTWSGYPSTNVNDDNTATRWTSASETNPNIYIDIGSNLLVSALAIYLDSNTTTTEIKIRSSTSTSFSDSDNLRTITVSNLTSGAWNYIRFNSKLHRYFQIYGTDGTAKVLSISEIKYLNPTNESYLVNHEHRTISSSDTSISLDGS